MLYLTGLRADARRSGASAGRRAAGCTPHKPHLTRRRGGGRQCRGDMMERAGHAHIHTPQSMIDPARCGASE